MPATSAEALLAELEALELTQPIGDPLDDEYRAVTARLAETSYALLTEMRKLGPPSAPNTSLSAAARAAIEERVAQLERMSEVLKDEQRALLAQIRKRDAEEEAGDAGKRAAARTKEPRRARTPKPAAATTAAEPALRSPEERIALADRIIATAVPLLWALSGGADDKLHVYEHLLRAGGIWVDTRYATARVPLYVNQLHEGGRPTSAVLQPLLAALPELELRLQIDNDGSTLSTMLTQAQLDQELVFWHGRLLHYVARAGPFPREQLEPQAAAGPRRHVVRALRRCAGTVCDLCRRRHAHAGQRPCRSRQRRAARAAAAAARVPAAGGAAQRTAPHPGGALGDS